MDSFFCYLKQSRQEFADICYDSIIASAENRGLRILVDADGDLRVPYSRHMLRLPGNSQCDIKIRSDPVVGDPNNMMCIKPVQLFAYRQ